MFDKHAPFGFLDELAGTLALAVLPIFVQPGSDKLLLRGFGSCFILNVGINDYLVTAYHVVAELPRYQQRYLILNERLVPFSNIAFVTDPENDLAVAKLCECWLADRDVALLPSIRYDPTLAEADVVDSGFLFVQGYPGSQNIVKGRYNHAKRELLSITLNEVTDAPSGTRVKSPLAVRYQESKMLDSYGKPKFRQVALNGMSGGVIFQVGVTRGADGAVQPLCRPAGVLLEWHRNDEIIVGADMNAVNKLLSLAPAMHAHIPTETSYVKGSCSCESA